MPNNETIERIQQIRERLAKATPGPWHSDGMCYVFSTKEETVAEMRGWGANLPQRFNAEFIANAPSDIEYLLAALSEMRTIALKEAAEIIHAENERILATQSGKDDEFNQQIDQRVRMLTCMLPDLEKKVLGRIDSL